MQISPAVMARLRADMPAHWEPILDALEAHDVAVLLLEPGDGPFTVTTEQPLITVIADDYPDGRGCKGPTMFDAPSLFGHLHAAEAAVLIAGAPQIEHYGVAASVAVLTRRNVVVVETRPEQQEPWMRLALAAGITRIMIVTPEVQGGTDMVIGRRPGQKLH